MRSFVFDVLEWCSENLEGSLRGDEFSGPCPFCGKTKKFSVNLTKGKFNCFSGSCGEKGSIAWLISKLSALSYREAKSLVNDGVDLSPQPPHQKPKAPAQNLIAHELPDEFIPCFESGRDPEYRVVKYLRDRGVSDSTLRCYGVGFAKAGPCANRVILPVRSKLGYAWTARDATGAADCKYWNPPGQWASHLLYGFDQIVDGQDLVIVEGPFDVLKLRDHGINAVALMGKELGAGQKQTLYSLSKTTYITILLDSTVSRLEQENLAAQLCMKFPNLYIANLSNGDPGNSTKEQAFAAIDGARKF